jgi:hypothetical protein
MGEMSKMFKDTGSELHMSALVGGSMIKIAKVSLCLRK